MNDGRRNIEHYSDPTAYNGIQNAMPDDVTQERVDLLISAMKKMVKACGFELIRRIELRDPDTGRIFR